MSKASIVALIVFVCMMQGCRLLSKSGRNYPTSDRPAHIKTTHSITRSSDSQINPDSSRVDFVTYDNIEKVSMPYTRIEIVGMQPALASRSGSYSAVLAKGLYTIKIGSRDVYTIKHVKLLGGTVTQIYIYLGGTIWR
jgi:hypothetical protein